MPMAQLMPLPLTVSCFNKIQIGFTFLVPAHPGSPGRRAIKRCVYVFTLLYLLLLLPLSRNLYVLQPVNDVYCIDVAKWHKFSLHIVHFLLIVDWVADPDLVNSKSCSSSMAVHSSRPLSSLSQQECSQKESTSKSSEHLF